MKFKAPASSGAFVSVDTCCVLRCTEVSQQMNASVQVRRFAPQENSGTFRLSPQA
jgi:hypothetical protein